MSSRHPLATLAPLALLLAACSDMSMEATNDLASPSAFDTAEELWQESRSKLQLDAGKYTDLAKRNYEKIVDLLEKNNAAYTKWRMTRHPDLNQLKDQIERWKQEQIARNKAKKDNQGGSGTGGGRGGRGFGSPGGPGGG